VYFLEIHSLYNVITGIVNVLGLYADPTLTVKILSRRARKYKHQIIIGFHMGKNCKVTMGKNSSNYINDQW
jgi:hypothetical protein